MVVTIVVLIILATISINAVFGENGLIKRAEAAKRLHEQGVTDEQTGLNEIDKYLGDKLNGVPEAPIMPEEPDTRPYVTTITTTDHGNIEAVDHLKNPVTMPGGFKISEESDDNVEDGIIIEDSEGNQFVWVPVSNIDGDGVVDNQSANGLITKKDGSKVQITLGRYTFARTSPGTQTLVQKGSQYVEENTGNRYTIKSDFTELTIFRESNYKQDTTGLNTTAYNLQGFIQSVRDNHGYYIARYEASFGSGDQPDSTKINTTEYITNQKPLSKPSTDHTRASNTEALTEGMLWNKITQGDASKVSRNMYAGNSYVESDLPNSYMWDTAIVYIQAMGNTNYANQTDGNGTLKNTGETGDEKCHIFDMAGNIEEWTTEYSAYASYSYATPGTKRGGYYNLYDYYVADRGNANAMYSGGSVGSIGFRATLYIK